MGFNNYVVNSLELHLFFARIMKEHSLFLMAGFTPVNKNFAERAEFFKNEFEKLLCQAVKASDGVIGCDVLRSCEIVTDCTAVAEKQTEKFTGIAINKEITEKEMNLSCARREEQFSREKIMQIRRMNRSALNLLDGLIALKENILKNVLCCKMFTANYPLLLEHIIREAKMYRKLVRSLECDGRLSIQTMRETECFWNRIMMEHAQFMRGLFDPTEAELIETANTFAEEYAELLKNCRSNCDRGDSESGNSLEETVKFRDFKAAGAMGIQDCKIRSVILPLLADHVLREANHYIRLLEQ